MCARARARGRGRARGRARARARARARVYAAANVYCCPGGPGQRYHHCLYVCLSFTHLSKVSARYILTTSSSLPCTRGGGERLSLTTHHLPPFRNLGNFVTPHLPVSFGRDIKAGGPFCLV